MVSPKDPGPFAEAEIGDDDDDAGALVELAEQVEEQGTAGGTKGQVAELVEDHGSFLLGHVLRIKFRLSSTGISRCA